MDSTNSIYNGPYSSSSGEDSPTVTTSKKRGVTFTESNHHRSRQNLTNIKPKPSKQDILTSPGGKSRVETRSSTNHGLMSPFRTFGLSDGDSLFDNDPSSWSDISLDKTSTGRGIMLSKLTSPGTTGESCIIIVIYLLLLFHPSSKKVMVCSIWQPLVSILCSTAVFVLFSLFVCLLLFSLQSSTLRVKKKIVFFCVVVAFELTYSSDLVFLGCAATIQSLIQLLVQVHPSNSVYKS